MCDFIKFSNADDEKSIVINQISDQADLQAVVNTVKNWSDEWLLRLNIDKCKTVSYYVKNPICTQYHITHENNTHIFKSNLFVTQNYTIPIKDGKIEQCVNRTQRQLSATLTGAQTDIYIR